MLSRENKQVIVEADVKAVIDQMGTVEDFEHADEDAVPNPHRNTYDFEGGTRSLFRDPDLRLVAGVSAGLGNYFNIPAIWFRLLFVLTTFIGGLGAILYIILWIVIPRAVSRADKMAMKGQKLTLQGFKNNLEEEISAVKGHMTDLKHQSKPFIYKLRDFLSDFFYHLGRFFRTSGKLLIKILGIFILLDCFAIAIGMIVLLAAVLIWNTGQFEIFPFTIVDNEYANWIYVSIFLAAFIPVLTIILLILKAIFNTQSISRSTAMVMLTIWLFAIGTGLYYGTKVAKGFRSSASFTQTAPLLKSSNNTYYLQLNDIKYLTGEDSTRLNIKSGFNGTINTDDEDFERNEPQNMHINIERSDVAQPVLVQTFRAKGSSYENALFNARGTRYLFSQQDSVLKFDRKLQRVSGTSWHDQEIQLTLKVPLNAVVVIDGEIDQYVWGVDLYQCELDNKRHDADWAAFTMTANGLECRVDTLVTIQPDTLKRVK
jgi:phage shock protein PspC (stress-responsive transcriptional regulator)